MANAPVTKYAATRDGFNIAYRVMGSGAPEVVFIPPWMSSVELDVDDPYVGPTVRRLASIGRLVSYDKRGGGMSDPLVPGATPAVEERVEELAAVLEDAEVERPTIFTGGDGAAIAMVFAASHPDKVSGLCLYAPFARVTEAPDYPIGLPLESLEALANAASESWGSGKVAPTAPSMAHDEAFLAWFGSYQRRSATPTAGRQFLRMAMDSDVRNVLPSIRVPTVVLHRRGDNLVPLEMGRYVADRIRDAEFVELEGQDHFWAIGETERILDAVEELATGAPVRVAATRSLATVLFTDIVGSTAKASELGDRRWRELLDAHDERVRRQVELFEGREIDTTGDGFLVTFDGPGRAIACARAIRGAVHGLGMQVRAGLHTGEVELRGNGLAGLAVHIGARVCALAGADEILVSGSVPPLVLGSGLRFAGRGEQELKGVPGSWSLFAVDD